MHLSIRASAILCLLATTASCDRWPWQEIPASQPAEVTQKFGDATIRIVYSRPVARGRELFGALLPYESIWHPGANDATYISFSDDMLVGGHPLPAGNYSLWTIPRPDEWTIIFSRDWDTYHEPYPEGRDALRLRVRPRSGEHMETMGFYFPFAERDHGTLHLHWGETVIPLALRLAE